MARGAYYRIENNPHYDPNNNTPWGQKERDQKKINIYYGQRLKMSLAMGHYDSKEDAIAFAELTCEVLNKNTKYDMRSNRYVIKPVDPLTQAIGMGDILHYKPLVGDQYTMEVIGINNDVITHERFVNGERIEGTFMMGDDLHSRIVKIDHVVNK
jgi:hypothetical protein